MQAKAASFPQAHRDTLVQVLQRQYEGLEVTEAVKGNLASLAEADTFTVTTGHQLNIFTGPLYFIFKIATVVKACRQLAAEHPGRRFVPVYWMASEDHDLAEINHMHLYGRTHTWATDQTGPVGRMSTEGLDAVMDEMPEKVPVFEEAYRTQPTLAGAVRHYVNALFGEYGVVVVDADDADLKRQFAPMMLSDLLEHRANDLAEMASQQLDALGYKTQIYPRKINLFYLEPGQRNRLVREGDTWEVLNTGTTFTEAELRAELEAHPERFSPNVVLRPLYQEVILPNLAYVGGPAEVAYWLQLKGVFDHCEVPFPLVMPRNFGLLINKRTAENMEGLGLSVTDLFADEQALIKQYVNQHSAQALSLAEEKQGLQQVYSQIKDKAIAVDPTLEGRIGAQLAETLKELEKLEKRLERTEKDRHEVAIGQIGKVKARLFPSGSLQERHDNFLMYYLPNRSLIEDLVSEFDAFDYRLHAFFE